MHHTVRGVYLQAFLVPSAQPCLPQNELLMTPCAFIFQTVLSGCNWPFQTFDSFYTDKQSPSLRRGPLHRFQHQSRHRITFQMSDSLSSFYSPSRKELFPVSVFAPACITLRKSRFHMHRQRKRMWEADHPPILPPLPPPSPNIYIFLYIYLIGGGGGIQSVKMCKDFGWLESITDYKTSSFAVFRWCCLHCLHSTPSRFFFCCIFRIYLP